MSAPGTPRRSASSSAAAGNLAPLTRKEFYDLAFELREYANDLAGHEPRRVVLKECHRFNGWLQKVRSYQQLAPLLQDVKGARPIARWQVMTLYVVIWGFVYLWSIGRVEGMAQVLLLNGMAVGLISLYFIPEGLYGTTIEHIEGKVLRVVQAMEGMLARDEVNFTEAAYFKARDALKNAHYELRQQLDLAHRDWR